jgi:hypothetical protein
MTFTLPSQILLRSWPSWPLLLVLAGASLATCISAKLNFSMYADITIPEGAVAYSVNAVFGEEPLYRDYTRMPYATTPYPPLFYVLSAMLTPVLGNDVEASLLGGRLVSTASALLALGAIYHLVRRSGGSRLAASIGVGCAASIDFLTPWAVTCRPDMLALALSLWALLYVQTADGRHDILAIAGLIAAASAKHSFVAAFAATMLWLGARGQWKRALKLGCAAGLGVGAVAAIAEWFSNGWFLANVVGANLAPASARRALALAELFVRGAFVPIALAVVGVCLATRRERRALSLILLYACISAIVAAASSVKAGADVNYFLEPGFAIAALAGGTWPAMERLIDRSLRHRVVGCCALFLLLTAPFINQAIKKTRTYARNDGRYAVAMPHIESLSGPVLIGDAGLAVRSGKRVLLLDKFNAAYLADRTDMAFAELVAMLQRREIAEVIADVPIDAKHHEQFWWPRPVREAIRNAYQFAGSIAEYRVYRPREGP